MEMHVMEIDITVNGEPHHVEIDGDMRLIDLLVSILFVRFCIEILSYVKAYLSDFDGANEFRQELLRVDTLGEMMRLLKLSIA